MARHSGVNSSMSVSLLIGRQPVAVAAVLAGQAAKVLAPAEVGLVGDRQLLAGFGDGLALAEQDVGLTQLVDDLLAWTRNSGSAQQLSCERLQTG